MDLTQDNALTDLMNAFIAKCIAGAANITPEALQLLGLLAIIDLALILVFSLLGPGEDPISLIAKKFIKYSFFVWLIQNWSTGMQITKQIFDFFDSMGAKVAGVSTSFTQPAAIGGKGIYLAESIFQSMFSLSSASMGVMALKFVLAVAIFACFAIIAIYMFVTTLQFYIFSTLTTVLLPFGVNKYTSFLSEKAIGAIFSIGIKMMTLEFVLCITMPFLASIDPVDPQATNIAETCRVLIGCAGMAWLAFKVPNMAQDLLSGNPSFGDGAAGAAGAMAKGAGGMAKAAVGGAMKGAGMVQAAANSEGGRGASGRMNAAGVARNLGRMARQSLPDRQAQQHGKQLFNGAKFIKPDQQKGKEQKDKK